VLDGHAVASKDYSEMPLARPFLGPSITFGLALATVACAKPESQTSRPPLAAAAQTATSQGPLRMDPVRLKRLREGIGSVSLGASLASVVSTIGEPDEMEAAGPKEPHPPEEDRRILVYNVVLIGAHRGNTQDQFLMMWFNHEDKLESISSTVEGIESRK